MSVPSEEYIFWQNYLTALKTFNSSLLLPESLKIGRGEKETGGRRHLSAAFISVFFWNKGRYFPTDKVFSDHLNTIFGVYINDD